MKSFALVAGFSVLCTNAVATAAVIVIGSSSARLCYESARAELASTSNIAQCDAAFANEALTADDKVATHVNRGVLRAVRGDLDGAVQDYNAALALDADEAEAWLNKAIVYLRNDDAAGALPLFDTAVAKLTAKPEIAHYGRAIAHEQLGNLRAAYADYRKASALVPGWNAPKVELARFRVRASATGTPR